MNIYMKNRRMYLLEVNVEDGIFTAKLTNRITGETSTNSGWKFFQTALEVVQDMYNKAIK